MMIFMFCKVLENHPDLCRKLLELALCREVGELVSVNRQKPIEILPDKKGVRFDIYSEGRGGKKGIRCGNAESKQGYSSEENKVQKTQDTPRP